MSRFLRSVEGDTRALRRRLRYASARTCGEAAQLLLSEYCELAGNNMTGEQQDRYMQLIALRNRIIFCTGCLNMAMKGCGGLPELFEMTGATTVQGAEAVVKSWINDTKVIENEINREREEKKNPSAGDADMNGLAIEVAKFLGFQINRETTTVYEFAGYVRSFQKYTEKLKAESRK
ncbi:MAG: hypothetical protein LBF89_11815 [Bacteroidales bacterium]|nr:hypothetical protein [Bacteroidales bacterium]